MNYSILIEIENTLRRNAPMIDEFVSETTKKQGTITVDKVDLPNVEIVLFFLRNTTVRKPVDGSTRRSRAGLARPGKCHVRKGVEIYWVYCSKKWVRWNRLPFTVL